MNETEKIVCITFTYPADAVRAARNSTLLPKHWKLIWCIEPKHADMPIPDGVEALVADFPRGGTLRDAAAVYAMAKVYVDMQTKYDADVVIKLDSDTALFQPHAWTKPIMECSADFVYIRRSFAEGRLLCNGCCYSMGRRAIERLKLRFYPNGIPAKFNGHEDLVFSSFFNAIEVDLYCSQINKERVYLCVRPYEEADTLAAHMGYISQSEALDTVNRILGKKGLPPCSPMDEYTGKVSEYIAKDPKKGLVAERRPI